MKFRCSKRIARQQASFHNILKPLFSFLSPFTRLGNHMSYLIVPATTLSSPTATKTNFASHLKSRLTYQTETARPPPKKKGCKKNCHKSSKHSHRGEALLHLYTPPSPSSTRTQCQLEKIKGMVRRRWGGCLMLQDW
jgi:hypothetical protein